LGSRRQELRKSGYATGEISTRHSSPVTFKTVRLSDFPVYLDGVGTVQPYDTVTVRSRVDGEVVNVAFKQGQMVKRGDVLVQIDPRPFEAALAQAQAKKAQDEATLRNAKLDLQRAITLAQQQAGPTQTVDTQQALVDQLSAQVQGDQANIDNAQTQLSYTTIKSPLTGRVGFRQIDPGNIVHATDPNGIVTIVKLQPISVVFTAPEEHVQSINKALDAGQVPVWALSSDGTKTLAEGHLAIVNNQVDLASGTIQMKATFENKNNVLWPGLSVLTRLQLEMLKQRRCRAERSRKAWAGRAVRVCDRCPEQGERASNQSEPRRRYDQSGSERADAGRSHRCRGTIPAHPGGIG